MSTPEQRRASNTKEAQCDGKHRFATKSDARRVAVSGRTKEGRPLRQAYRCGVCRGFHVGTVQKNVRRQLLEVREAEAMEC